MIQVTALSKRFGNRTAVNTVSFQARPGEIFGLLGENGAGKTTTLRMIATVLSPDDGDISVYGRSVRKEPQEVRRHLGFLTADAGLYNRLSAKENVEYFGQLWGVDRNTVRRRTAEIFARSELFRLVTFLMCALAAALALRGATRRFNQESILFRQ